MNQQMELQIVQESEKKFEGLKYEMSETARIVRDLTISDDKGYEIAVGIAKDVADKIKRIEAEFAPSKKAAHEAHKAITALEKKLIDPLKEAKAVLSQRAGAYHAAKLAEERRKEELRLAEARKAAEAAAIEQAAALEAAGDKEGAEIALHEAAEAPAIIPTIPVEGAPKVDGVVHRKRWKFRVVDLELVPREFMALDETKVRKYGEAMKESAKIPGIEFFVETESAFGGGR